MIDVWARLSTWTCAARRIFADLTLDAVLDEMRAGSGKSQ